MSSIRIALGIITIVAASLVAPSERVSAEAADLVLPAAVPECVTDEDGFSVVGEGEWGEHEGRPVASCTFDDAALPPIFPRNELSLNVIHQPAAETAALWASLFGGDGSEISRGTPTDLVATISAGFLGDQVWCAGAADGPLGDCSWVVFGAVLTGDCSIASFDATVQAVDAPALAIGEVPPDFDWDAIRRVAVDLAEATGGSVDPIHRPECARTCEISGTSVDRFGVPVRYARVAVFHTGGIVGWGSTDVDGVYSVRFGCERTATFDPESDRVFVSLLLSDADARYDIYGGPTGAVIARFDSDGITITEERDDYRRDFRFGSIPGNYFENAGNVVKAQWFEWVEIYQNTAEAFELVDLLGVELDYALPLDVVGNCTRATCRGKGANFAFMSEDGDDPYIGLGTAASRFTDPDRPDNREYHEVGHFILADVWDNDSPRGGRGSVNHGGIANADSTEGFIEGFAEWFSTMVQKHVLGDANAHIYNWSDGPTDFEIDIEVWTPRYGKNAEEFAIAGLLLDLEDGPSDYRIDPVRPAVSTQDVVAVRTLSSRLQSYEVTIGNDGRATTDPLVVTMVLLENGVEVRRVPALPSPRTLAPGHQTTVLIPVPIALSLSTTWDDFRIEVTENLMARTGIDDDGIDLRLDEVWDTMRDYRSPVTGRRTENVFDLYQAFSEVMTTPDEQAELDKLFIAHGLYTDRDGQHDAYNPVVDTIGRTDTPTHGVRFAPEHDVPGTELHIGGLPAGAEVDLIILPAAPVEHLARVERVEVDASGVVVLVGPPAAIGGHVIVVGHRPNGTSFVIADYTAAELTAQVETGVAREIDVTDIYNEGRTTPGSGGSTGTGYRMLEADGSVHAFGSATHLGDPSQVLAPDTNAVAMAVSPSGEGYSILTDGDIVHRYGDAPALGSSRAVSLLAGERLTTISISPSGEGTWIFSNRGRALTFGDAQHFGDLLELDLQGEIIGSVVTPSGNGYYLIGDDGGVFAFGDAVFYGSIQGVVNELVEPGFPASQWLACPIVALVPTPDSAGYWLVACDGGVFSFGEATYAGSVPEVLPGVVLNQPVNGMVAYGGGYLMVASDGGAFNFGAPFFGSLGASPPNDPIVAITPYAG